MYLSTTDIKRIQKDINNLKINPDEIKVLIHEHFLLKSFAEDIHNVCRAYHKERRKRVVQELEIRSIIAYCRRMAYHMLKDVKNKVKDDEIK